MNTGDSMHSKKVTITNVSITKIPTRKKVIAILPKPQSTKYRILCDNGDTKPFYARPWETDYTTKKVNTSYQRSSPVKRVVFPNRLENSNLNTILPLRSDAKQEDLGYSSPTREDQLLHHLLSSAKVI